MRLIEGRIYSYDHYTGRLRAEKDDEGYYLIFYDISCREQTFLVPSLEKLKEATMEEKLKFLSKENRGQLIYNYTNKYIVTRNGSRKQFSVFVDDILLPVTAPTAEGALLLGISYTTTGSVDSARYAAKLLDIPLE